MVEHDALQTATASPGSRPIFVVSGGMGSIGEVVVRSSPAQFERAEVPVSVIPRIRHVAQIDEVIERVAAANGMIAHSMMDANLRQALTQAADARRIPSIDLVGHLLGWLSNGRGSLPPWMSPINQLRRVPRR